MSFEFKSLLHLFLAIFLHLQHGPHKDEEIMYVRYLTRYSMNGSSPPLSRQTRERVVNTGIFAKMQGETRGKCLEMVSLKIYLYLKFLSITCEMCLSPHLIPTTTLSLQDSCEEVAISSRLPRQLPLLNTLHSLVLPFSPPPPILKSSVVLSEAL